MIKYQNRQGNILWQQTILWVLIGFLISYMLFFIRPVFLNPEHEMQFNKYISSLNPIGADMRQGLGLTRAVFVQKQPLEVEKGLCLPIQCIFYKPIINMDFPKAYAIMTVINLLTYLFITLIFPLLVSKEKGISPLLMLILVTGLFSYGFQFELERGNYNIFTIFFCFLAIYIYHYYHKLRYLAYVLFSISIQLKLYPAIFILMFVKDWSDWKGNIKRVLGIFTFTFISFFILGIDYFFHFYKAIKTFSISPIVWKGNHSIRGFVSYLTSIEYKLPEWAKWIGDYAPQVQIILLALLLIFLLIVLLKAYSQKESGLNPYLLLACTIGALLIPSEGQDYKLSLLAGPVAIFLNAAYISNTSIQRRILPNLLITIISFAYSSTLFSYVNKPFLLRNNLPALYVILVACTLFYMLKKTDTTSISEFIEK